VSVPSALRAPAPVNLGVSLFGESAPTMSTCIFCGNNANSKEHIWPDWLKDYVPRLFSERIHQASTNRWDKEQKKLVIETFRESVRPGDPHAQKLRIVCSKCNGGWMSQLQSEAKPLLVPLINGEFYKLLPNEIEAISRWAAMFTMVVEFKNKAGVAVSQEQRDSFKITQSVPKGWHISIGYYTGQKWRGAFNHLAVIIAENENENENENEDEGEGEAALGRLFENWGDKPPNMQTTTFAVGKAIFNTLSCSNTMFDPLLSSMYTEFSNNHGMSILHGSSSGEYIAPTVKIGDIEANLLSNAFIKDEAARGILRAPT
jgi:hypothetical protein